MNTFQEIVALNSRILKILNSSVSEGTRDRIQSTYRTMKSVEDSFIKSQADRIRKSGCLDRLNASVVHFERDIRNLLNRNYSVEPKP